MKRMVFFLIAVCFFSSADVARADTIYTRQGKEIKGIVVEDYNDRIVFSTADGEITIMKPDIRELYYDSEEDNLIKLAEQAKEKKDYVRAFIYYDKALKVNPQSKKALEGTVFLQGYLFRKDQLQKEEDIKKREAIENYGTAIKEEPSEGEKLKQKADTLYKSLGIAIKMESGTPVVESVRLKSPAQEAGIKRGDRLIAVWSRLTGYLSNDEVLDMLLDKPSLELKCTMERDVDVHLDPGNVIGASFSMEFDGLTVAGVREGAAAARAGLKKADLVTSINGQSTRYMQLKAAMEKIRCSKGRLAKFAIRREVLIWRKD
jgi:C-terminal processing protease CtpA/Prc